MLQRLEPINSWEDVTILKTMLHTNPSPPHYYHIIINTNSNYMYLSL